MIVRGKLYEHAICQFLSCSDNFRSVYYDMSAIKVSLDTKIGQYQQLFWIFEFLTVTLLYSIREWWKFPLDPTLSFHHYSNNLYKIQLTSWLWVITIIMFNTYSYKQQQIATKLLPWHSPIITTHTFLSNTCCFYYFIQYMEACRNTKPILFVHTIELFWCKTTKIMFHNTP